METKMKVLLGLILLGSAIVCGVLYEQGRKKHGIRKEENRYFLLLVIFGLLGFGFLMAGFGVSGRSFDPDLLDYRTRGAG